MPTLANRLTRLETQAKEEEKRWVESLTTEELIALIEQIEQNLIENHGWTREWLDRETCACVVRDGRYDADTSVTLAGLREALRTTQEQKRG